MLQLVYFFIFAFCLIVTITIYSLYQKGYRIRYVDKQIKVENIKKSVELVADKLVDVGFNVSSLVMEPEYIKLKKDFPNLDIIRMKQDIKDYILAKFKNKKIDYKDTTLDFSSDLELLTKDNDISEVVIMPIILEKYIKEVPYYIIRFNITIEYTQKYDSGAPFRNQSNYVMEFTHLLNEYKGRKIIKCPKCDNDLFNNKECKNCHIDKSDDIWYLKRIEKK